MAGTEVEIGKVPPAATALEILNTQVGGTMILSPGFEILWVNDTAREIAPRFGVGQAFRPLLEELSEEQKIDRLLFNRERVLAPAEPGGADLYWLMHPQEMEDGNLLLYVWDPDLSEDMHDRRIAFLAGAAHELRSPLTAIIGFVELLGGDREGLTDSQLEAVEMIEQNAAYLKRLVDDVFDLTRNSFGELPLEIEEVSVGTIVTIACSALEPAIAAKGQTITCRIEEGLPAIEADPGRLNQMVTNLVGNANAHCPEGTSIEVSCTVDERTGEVAIEVADDGPGFPFEDPDEAFRSFRSGGPQNAAEMSGAGIGLSLTKRLVQLHRGRIFLSSEPDGGTRVTIRLPIDREAAAPRYAPGPV